jgi:hypothetical protein
MPTPVSKGLTIPLVLLGGWAGLFAGILLALTPVTVLLGTPLTLVIPGALLVQVLRLHANRLESWALAVAGSLAVLVLSVGLASLMPSGITRISVAGVLAGLTAVLVVVRSMLVHRGVVGLGPGLRALESIRVPSGRRTLLWGATGVVVAACATAALWISVGTERSSAEQPLTQLSLTRNTDSTSYVLEVHNLEGRQTTYRLEVTLPGATTTSRSLTLGDDQTYTETLRPDAAGKAVARLYGGSTTGLGYRQAEASVP